jgi:GntR family transcriptional repressor for pyruvate dehydrogenase complex
MMEVRRILETECAALAAVRSTPDDLAKMANCLLKMRNAESIPEGVEADLRFHFAIAEATKNNVLLRIMNTVSDLMHNTLRQARENLYADPNHGPRILQEHEAILTAIKEKRPDEAWAKMVEHINNIEEGINCASPLLPAEEK